MDYWTPLALGLAGSLHCAGMCGPLALAVPAPGKGAATFLISRTLYNIGRIMTYSLLGVLFGVLGKTLFFAGIQRWFSIALGALLLIGLFSSTRLGLSKPVSNIVVRLRSAMSLFLRKRSVSSLFMLGMLNGLLPCGLVYVAAAAATINGSILGGVLFMAVFGLGTLPMMLSIGLSGRLIPPAVRLQFTRAVPVSVFLLATLLIFRGLGLGIPYLSPNLAEGSCCHR